MSRLCGAIRFAINFYTFNGVTRVSTNNLRQFDGKKLIPHNLDQKALIFSAGFAEKKIDQTFVKKAVFAVPQKESCFDLK